MPGWVVEPVVRCSQRHFSHVRRVALLSPLANQSAHSSEHRRTAIPLRPLADTAVPMGKFHAKIFFVKCLPYFSLWTPAADYFSEQQWDDAGSLGGLCSRGHLRNRTDSCWRAALEW